MWIADKAPAWFYRFGALLFALHAFVFAVGIGPQQLGVWGTQEPRLIAVFLASAVSCLWFWIGFYRNWLGTPTPLPRFFVLLLAWIGWQLVVLLLAATSPWRTWFGTADYGEGTGWYLCLVMLTSLAYALWADMRSRRWLFFSAVAALIVSTAIQASNPPDGFWQILWWPDYLAFFICWLCLVAYQLYPSMNAQALFKFNLGAMLLITFMRNEAVGVFFFCAIVVSQIAAEYGAARKLDHPPVPRYWRWLACIACVVPVAYVLASLVVPYSFTSGLGVSISTRMHLNSISLHALWDEPARLIFGSGWNSFEDLYTRYAMTGGIKLFQNGTLDANIDSVFGGGFHSHNQPMEALLSLGIPGVIIWFAMIFHVIRHVPDRLFWRVVPVHVALVLASYFWFYLSFYIAFIALYWATVMHMTAPAKAPRIENNVRTQYYSLAFIPLGFVLLWSAWEQTRATLYGEWLKNAVHAPYENVSMAQILEDIPRGGERFWLVTNQFLGQIAAKDPSLGPDTPQWIEKLMDAGYLMSAQKGIGVSAGNVDLTVQFYLMTRGLTAGYERARASSFALYPATVVRAARQAPLREDLAAPYLYQLESDKNTEALSLIIPRLLDANPNHRIALWLLGKQWLSIPSRQEDGHALMKQALDAGVADIYPITAEEAARIQEN